MANYQYSRRKFLKQNALTTLGAAWGAGMTVPVMQQVSAAVPLPVDNGKSVKIKPRYVRWHVDPGVEWLETNLGHRYLDWEIPLSQCALVLVDVWSHHYIKEPQERAEAIINTKLSPLVEKCRKEGLQLIHAPSYSEASKSPNWIKLNTEADRFYEPDNWPPADFLGKKGSYKVYSRPNEPREAERLVIRSKVQIHPKIKPIGNEPVVCSGKELHEYCRKNGKLILIYAGFNTNGCILSRSYGTIHMGNRGYGIVLVRDCTTGMEIKETQSGLKQTNGAITLLEMWGHYTVTADEIMNGFSA